MPGGAVGDEFDGSQPRLLFARFSLELCRLARQPLQILNVVAQFLQFATESATTFL